MLELTPLVKMPFFVLGIMHSHPGTVCSYIIVQEKLKFGYSNCKLNVISANFSTAHLELQLILRVCYCKLEMLCSGESKLYVISA